MSDDGSGGNPFSSVVGAVSISTVINKLLDQAAPVISETIGIDLNVVITGLVFFAMLATSWYHIQRFVADLFENYYSCTVRMTSEDSMFAATMEYLEERKVFGTPAEQEARKRANKIAGVEDEICGVTKRKGGMAWYARPTRNLDANMDSWKLDLFYEDSDDEGGRSDEEEDLALDEDNEGLTNGTNEIAQRIKIKKRVKYAPSPSYAHYFYFKPTGHTVKVIRMESNNNGAWWRRQREHLSLSIYGRDQTPLKQFLALVVDRENKKDIGRTTVFKAMPGQDAGPRWVRCFSRATRPIDTVVLDEEQKTRICDDIAEYLMPATRKWYGNRGLPYRRGYLLYGPPGTGKTSLTVALAGKFGLRVYSLSLSAVWMNDDTLSQLFSHLPKTCIVLLEDIDACGVTREGDTKAAAVQQVVENNTSQTSSPNSTTATGTRVTFSGLLNALDGVASKEGRLLIMTTNHRERLDEALLRPGRCDLQIKFHYADRGIIHDLFRALYQVDDTSRTLLRFPGNFPEVKELDRLATEFAAKVPEGVFSPAEVQGHLLKYKKEPRKALELVEEWIEETKREHLERRLREEKEKAEREKREAEEKEKKEKEKEGKSDSSSVSAESLPDDVKINGAVSD